MIGRLRQRAALAWVGAILLVHAIVVQLYTVPVLYGTDANAYQVSAGLLADEGRFYQVPRDEYAFVGIMWVENERGEFYPKYPPLYPAALAGARVLFGDTAGLRFSAVMGTLAVLGMYVLSRAFVPGWAAVLAAWMIASNPIVNNFAIRQESHATSVALEIWALALFFHGLRRAGWRRVAMLLGCGFLLGYVTGVRYPNLLLALAPAAWLAGRAGGSRGKDLVAFAAGLALPCAFLAVYHQVAFGSPLTTGYALTREQSAFGLRTFAAHLPLYVPAILRDLIGPLAVLSACGFALAWARDWRKGAFYAIWIVPLTALYTAYYWTIEHNVINYVRFFLPLLVVCAPLAASFAQTMLAGLEGERRAWWLAVAALFLVQSGWGVLVSIREMEAPFAIHDRLRRSTDTVRAAAAPGSVVFGDVEMLWALDDERPYVLYGSELLDRAQLQRMLQLIGAMEGGPDAMQMERALALKAKLLDVDEETYERRVHGLIDAPLAAGRAVYLVGPQARIARFRELHGGSYEAEIVARLPAAPRRHLLLDPARLGAAPGARSWDAFVVAALTRK